MVTYSVEESIRLGLHGQLSCQLGLNVNSRYGTSDAALVLEAIQTHRDFLFGQFLDQRIQGEYKNSFSYYNDFMSLQGVIDNFAESAIKLAFHNSETSDYKTIEQFNQSQEEARRRRREDYERFLEMVVYGKDGKAADESPLSQ